MTNVTRTTSVYTILTPGDEALLEQMKAACPAQVHSMYLRDGEVAVFRYRTEGGDERALEIAELLTVGRDFSLSTGVGINNRTVH